MTLNSVSGDCPKFLSKVKLYGLHIWPVHSQGPSEQMHIKNFGAKGAWAYPWTVQSFKYPLLSQKRVKLRTSNFVRTLIGSIGTKPIKSCGKSSSGAEWAWSGTPEIFQSTHTVYRVHRAVIFAIARHLFYLQPPAYVCMRHCLA